MDHGAPAAAPAAAGHEGHVMPAPPPPAATAGHDGHVMPPAPSAAETTASVRADTTSVQRRLALQRALLRDPVIRRRIVTNPALRQQMLEATEGLSEAERAELRRLLTPARR